MSVTYDKAVRARAVEKGYGLGCVSYNGSTFPKGQGHERGQIDMQFPLSPYKAKLLLQFMKDLKAAPEVEPGK